MCKLNLREAKFTLNNVEFNIWRDQNLKDNVAFLKSSYTLPIDELVITNENWY